MAWTLTKAKPFRFPFAPMAPLISAVQRDYHVNKDLAVSIIVSHGKTCNVSFSEYGWPYEGNAVATRRTSLRDLVDFLYPFGFRLTWQTNGLVPVAVAK